MLFNEKLIRRRKERGMTQEDLAECLSVSRQTVSKWENGECMPDTDKFIRLSDVLEMSLDELAGREEAVEPAVPPAPEVPQPKNKLRRALAITVTCLILCVGAFALGRYVFPKTAPAETALPETLSVRGVSVSGNTDGGWSMQFHANASVNGTVFLYQGGMKPMQLPAVYEKGVYTVSGLPKGSYERIILVITSEAQERSAVVAENMMIDAEGASWTNPD